MKWLSKKGSKKQNSDEKRLAKRNEPGFMPSAWGLMMCLCLAVAGAGAFLLVDTFRFKNFFYPKPASEFSTDVEKIAASISVKILDRDFLGSGFIVRSENNSYTVITNQHVLRAGDAPYKIQTPDGKVHTATKIEQSVESDYEYDLAILQFSSDTDYAVAKIGSSLFLEVGESIYAAGFPYTEMEAKTTSNRPNKITGLALKEGRISIILNQALVEGYQIGYTNDVKKGMSGGALLNSRGEVVGINGKHAYPLWESPELFQDGSQPCPALEKLIIRSSLAIPIEKSIELNPQLKDIASKSNVEVTRRSNLTSEDAKKIAEMQEEAIATTESCEQYGEDLVDDLLNGESLVDGEE